MKKMYVIVYGHEKTNIQGVFSSIKKARQALEKVDRKNPSNQEQFDIHSFNLDKFYDLGDAWDIEGGLPGITGEHE